MTSKKIKVIEVTKDGKIGFLAKTNDFYKKTLVDSPVNAIIYHDEEALTSDLNNLYIVGVGGAKSGVHADSVDVVEFEVQLKEKSRKQARVGK